MKKKGFTLIELIVVIAIIAVLAAILIPAMLGFIKKSKITSANSAAKSIFTAAQSALTDMDTEDTYNTGVWKETFSYAGTLSSFFNSAAGSGAATGKTNTAAMKQVFQQKVYNYFTDITKLSGVAFEIKSGSCTAVAVVNGNYPGTTPKQYVVDDYDSDTTYTDVMTALLVTAQKNN